MKLRNKKTGEAVEVDFEKIYKSIKDTRASYNTDWNNWHREKYGHAPNCPKPTPRPEDVLEKFGYNSLAELNEEWEDYEEPKEYYFIAGRGDVEHSLDRGDIYDIKHKDMGNYFETKEEAEQAVEKLKAWKRLKDKGFRFTYWKKSCNTDGKVVFHLDELGERLASFRNDLDLLFSEEDD